MNPSHRALRDATRAAHERVDTVFAGFDLQTRDGYARFLAAHADALLPIEAALDAAGADRVTDDWATRKRGALIRADLEQLRSGAGQDTARSEYAPPSHPGARGDDAADAGTASIAGTLYVLEGSRLGGRFIARSLPADFPRAYLDADQVSGNWRKLLDCLDLILYDSAQLQSAVAAARRAFAAFERSGEAWLAKG